MNYTEEQKIDITERVEKARVFLNENNLSLSAQVTSVNMGDNVFANKVTPYLQDTKYVEDNKEYTKTK